MSFKKIVHYIPTIDDKIEVNRSAWLFHVIDHPNLRPDNRDGQTVATSIVTQTHGTDGFETLNTIYVPQKPSEETANAVPSM